jgi:uncharacterized protein (DUF4415 family)
MTDDQIDTSEMPEVTRDQIRNARWVIPDGYVPVRFTIDDDLADWLAASGPDRDRVINTALREYRERHAQPA